MSVGDIVILALAGVAFVWAVYRTLHPKRGCCGDCSRCGKERGCVSKNKTPKTKG